MAMAMTRRPAKTPARISPKLLDVAGIDIFWPTLESAFRSA